MTPGRDTPVPDGAGASLDKVVNALNALRDTLITVSLLLQDYRFEVDEAGRRDVGNAVNELLNKVRAFPGKP